MRRGDVIDGRFQIEQLVAAGGMGSVYRALDRQVGGHAAIKVSHRPDDRDSRRFRREVRVLAELEHPVIVRYVGHGELPSGQTYLAMEWLKGQDLEQRLRTGRLTVEEGVALIVRVAEALAAAHERGVVHRDVKPSNVFLVDGRIDRAKLVDFGLARFDDAEWSGTGTGLLVGTMGYMAPEQAAGESDIDARADIFSLGCVLFQALTGKRPFDAIGPLALLAKVLLEETPPLRALVPKAPGQLERLLSRMLAKRRDARPADMSTLLDELRSIQNQQGERGAGLTVAPPRRQTPLAKQERRLVALVVAGDPTSTINPATRLKSDLTPQGWLALRHALEAQHATGHRLANGAFLATLSSFASATDLAAAAARTALELRRRLPEMPVATVTGWTELDGVAPVGDLIDRAAVLLGARGARHKVGASRVAAVVDETTSHLLGPQFDVRRSSLVHELRGERDSAFPAPRVADRAAPFVGRDREQRTLRDLFEDCRKQQSARALLVTADPGLGKTRLASEFVRWILEERHATVWTARGDPVGAGSPFRLVGQLVRAATAVREAEPEKERRRKLRKRVAHGMKGPSLERTAAFLGEIIRTPFPDAKLEELRTARDDASIMADQIQLAWEALVSSGCKRGPLVLVLDDLQWGDQVTVGLIDAALRNLRQRPIMVLALARPEVRRAFPELWVAHDLREIRLRALSPKASKDLVRTVIPQADAGLVTSLVERADGHPFLLEELARCAQRGQVGRASSGGAPEAALAIVQSRFERLSPAARRVLRTASVFGETFWLGALRALLQDEHAVDATLEELTTEELVLRQSKSRFEADHAYAFRHSLVREAAYAMLTEEGRMQAHRATGEWLEHMGESDPMVLAEHYERGGDQEPAARWYERAANDALSGNDLAGAVARAENGIACGVAGEPLGRLLLIQADASQWSAESERALKLASAARENLKPGSREWFAAGRILVVAAGSLGQGDVVFDVAEFLRTTQAAPEARVHRLIALAWSAMQVVLAGNSRLGNDLLREAEEEVRVVPNRPELMGVIHNVKPFVKVGMSSVTGLPSFVRATSQFERAGDMRNAAIARLNIAMTLLDVGQYSRAEKMLRRSLVESERLGNRIAVACGLLNLAECLWRTHRLTEARELLTRVLPWSRGEERRLGGHAAFHLSLIDLAERRFDRARAMARQARAAWKASALMPIAHGALAQVWLEGGEPTRALRASRRGMALLGTAQPESHDMMLRLVHAEALHAAGLEESRTAIAEARSVLLARARGIEDAALRRSFLTNVKENARILALAKKWVDGKPSPASGTRGRRS